MKLTLRDLFWLVLVVALALGWWIDRQRLVQRAMSPPNLAQAGRWELVIGRDGLEILIDTATGDTWTYTSYQWNYRKTPAK